MSSGDDNDDNQEEPLELEGYASKSLCAGMSIAMARDEEISFQFTEPNGSRKGKFDAWCVKIIEFEQYIF